MGFLPVILMGDNSCTPCHTFHRTHHSWHPHTSTTLGFLQCRHNHHIPPESPTPNVLGLHPRNHYLQSRFWCYRHTHSSDDKTATSYTTCTISPPHRSSSRVLRCQQHSSHLPLRRRHTTPATHYSHDPSLRIQRRRSCR
jgi:hypothetical protein